MTTQIAHIVGVERPFGTEIAEALEGRGVTLADGDTAPHIDVLVVNRPVVITQLTFADLTDADFDAAMNDLLYSVVQTVQSALPRLSAGSRVVLVGSRGHLGAWGGAHLMAASAALAGVMRTMALELAGNGLSVNLVAAGFIGTPWDTPASRQHVANAVCMLAEANTGLVGEIIIVDGGRSLRMSESRRQ